MRGLSFHQQSESLSSFLLPNPPCRVLGCTDRSQLPTCSQICHAEPSVPYAVSQQRVQPLCHYSPVPRD